MTMMSEQVDIPLVVGHTLGPFTLGQTLFSTIQSLLWRIPNSRVHVSSDSSPRSTMTILAVLQRGSVYVLKFDTSFQMLISISCTLSMNTDQKIVVSGTIKASLKHNVSVDDIKAMFGKPFNESNFDQRTLVAYEGTSFLFTLSETSSKMQLTEIRLASPHNSELAMLWHPTFLPNAIPQDFIFPRIQVVVDVDSNAITGVQLTYCQEDRQQNHTMLSFGDHFQDVITQLGFADRVYYKDSDHFSRIGSLSRFHQCSAFTSDYIVLNYFYLGLDVIFDSRKNTVTKIIMHTNVRDQSNYCSYSRCFFVFSLSKTGVAVNRTMEETLLVCPDSNWSLVQSFVEESCCQKLTKCRFGPSSNSIYPFRETSFHTLSNQMIVETTWCNDIAAVTLLTPSISVGYHSCQYTIHQAHSLLPTREEELEIPVSPPATKFISDRSESSISCDDDEFHSAESSLTGIPNASVESQSEARVSNLHAIFTVSVKAFYGPNVNVIKCPSESTFTYDSHPKVMVYDFHDDDDVEALSRTADNSNNNSTLEYTSGSLTITSGIINDVSTEIPSPDVESSSELDSFDFLSHAEILESQRAADQHAMSTTEEIQSLSEDGTADNESSTLHELTLPPDPEFHYKPKAMDTSMYSSRTTVLGEDIGLLTKSASETTSGDLLTKSKLTKGSSSPIIIHKRAGTNLSSKEETMKRLLGHTKSSQQRVKQKYTSTQKVESEQTAEVYRIEKGTDESDADENIADGNEDNLTEDHQIVPNDTEFTTNPHPCVSPSSNEPLAQVTTAVAVSPRTEQVFTTASVDASEHFSSQSTNLASLSLSPVPDSGVLSPDNVPVDSIGHSSHPGENRTNSHEIVEFPTIDPHHKEPEFSLSRQGAVTHTELPNSLSAPNGTYDGVVLTTHPVNPRKRWEDNENSALSLEYGPPSMTQDRVLFELITCEHEEVCTRLQERYKALSHVQQMVADPDATVTLSDLQHMLLENDALLYDLLSGLNSREEWTLQLCAELVTHLQNWFQSAETKHLLLGSKIILKICETHFEGLSNYVSGRVTMFTPSELSQCQKICATLSEVAVSVGQNLTSLQQTPDTCSNLEVIQQLTIVKTAVAKVLR